MKQKQLPLGTEDFKEMREKSLYYVDKTGFIKELLKEHAKITLFTRPRRFGKTLIMSMLQHFFEFGADKAIFDGLAISKEKELCEQYMGKYPVISISLKGVEGRDYEAAKERMWSVIGNEASRLSFLLQSHSIDDIEKSNFIALRTKSGNLEESLELICQLLYKHFKKKVIVLIDEYDVPLDKAYHYGYYDDMVLLLRQMFGAVLKTNSSLEFAVLTGCLRVSKESIFTGLNNLIVRTIANTAFDNWFGFTDSEVRQLLNYYNLDKYYSITKEWYDGYCFGDVELYCPWDVINWCSYLQTESLLIPQNFWVNTSSNELIRTFAENADATKREQIAKLIDGESIFKKIQLDLTYAEINESIENLWSVLYTTGYLTRKSVDENGNYELCIPNCEIRSIFIEKIEKWFSDKVLEDTEGLKEFVDCILDGDAEGIQDCLFDVLNESISYLDGGQTVELKESFYHGLLIGMLKSNSKWDVLSNRESGNGRADIIVYPKKRRFGKAAFIIEVKYSKTRENLEKKAIEALAQIDEKQYDNFFINRKIETITHYGIAFYGKECYVAKCEKLNQSK